VQGERSHNGPTTPPAAAAAGGATAAPLGGGTAGEPAPGAPAGEAVAALFDRYGGSLYGLALRLCGDAAEADDLVQEVFLHAYRGWPGFRGQASARTWLHTIAVRACRRLRRRRAGAPAEGLPLGALLPFEGDSLPAAGGEGGLEAAVGDEARRRLEGAIADLPEDFRLPVVLKEIAGLPVAEVAAVLGLPEGTVRSRLHRARLRLRAAVDAALPRAPGRAPPPAYDRQTCLDLLQAKQRAMDAGVPLAGEVVCERCRAVFATLDLARELCGQLAGGDPPARVRERLERALALEASHAAGGRHAADGREGRATNRGGNTNG